MSALELLENKLISSNIESIKTIGIQETINANDLDCNCVDSDCSTDNYD